MRLTRPTLGTSTIVQVKFLYNLILYSYMYIASDYCTYGNARLAKEIVIEAS